MSTVTGTERRSRWIYAEGIIGITSMVLLVGGAVTGPSKLISTNSTVTQIVKSISAHPTQEVFSDTLAMIACALFLGYAASLAHRLNRAEPEVPLGFWLLAAGTTIAIFGALDNLVLTLMNFLSRQGNLTTEPALTRMLYHLYNGLFMPGLTHLGFAAYFAVIAVAAQRNHIRPRWLTWPCAVLALIATLNGIVSLATTNGGAFPLAPLAVLGFVVVTITNSIATLRQTRRPT